MKDGFTLVESFIVFFLMAIISSVLFANFPSFSRQTSLERDAQLLALAFRDAESRALSIQESDGSFDNYFGVHVDITSEQKRKRYVLFADINGTSFFDNPGEELRIGTLSSNTRISRICRALRDASSLNNDCSLSCLSITFERPSPVVSVRGASGGVGCNTPLVLNEGDFEIEIESNDNTLKRCVVVWTTGTISIESNAC